MSVSELKTTKWHAIAGSEAVERLGVDPATGLSPGEAEQRLEQYGPNQVSRGARKSRWAVFLHQFTDPLVVVLLAAAVVTLLKRDFVDMWVILAVVVANAIIGYAQEQKAESAIESLSKMLTVEATVLRGGSNLPLSAEGLVPGDIVVMQAGDKVPADLRILDEKGLQVDESVLTGESAPVSKCRESVAEDVAVSDRTNMAYSGTLVTAGTGYGVVTATGDATELGRISSLIQTAPEMATPLTRKLAVFGKLLSLVVIIISAIAFGIGLLSGYGAGHMFSAAVAIAVAMIPEGLPAIVTIVMAVGVKRMADRNSIIRTLPSVETLGSVTVICSDKTGTLTANEMTVKAAFAGNHDYELSGIGYNPEGAQVIPVDTENTELTSEALTELFRCGLLCNDSGLTVQDDNWIPSGDPTEVALIVSARKSGLNPGAEAAAHKRVDVLPFESANMYMATLNESPEGGRVIYVKGSLESVLSRCSAQKCDSGEGDLDKHRVTERAAALALQGYRVLAFAFKPVSGDMDSVTPDDLNDLIFLGLQAMSDPPRPEAIAAVNRCKVAGIEVKMITGDHVETAKAIARAMGIGGSNPRALTGSELANLNDEEFAAAAREVSVFARVAPEQKYRLVESLQNQGKIVAMTGDGVNDAPALKKADIGVAMGRAGSDVAKDASDMVLTDDNFASIVAAVEEGRTVFSNLVKSLAFILPTNLGEGLIIVAALVVGATLPITPVQILWINTVTAITLALPLAFEPKEPGIMGIPPRDPAQPIITGRLFTRILTVGFYIVLAGFAVFLYEKNIIGASDELARTAAVSTVVMIEVFYLFAARTEQVNIFKSGLLSNAYVWVGVTLVVLLQLAFVHTGLLNFVFKSEPLSAVGWLRVVVASLPVLLMVTAEKWIMNRLSPVRA